MSLREKGDTVVEQDCITMGGRMRWGRVEPRTLRDRFRVKLVFRGTNIGYLNSSLSIAVARHFFPSLETI